MTITKQLPFLCSLFFLLNVASPILVLLSSSDELSTIVLSPEKETETKDIKDVKDLNEFDVDKTPFQKVNLTLNRQSLSFVFYNKALSDTPLENTSPPPEFM